MEGSFIGGDEYQKYFLFRDYLVIFYSFDSGFVFEVEMFKFNLECFYKIFGLGEQRGNFIFVVF